MDEKMKIEGKGELRSQPWPRQFDNNPSKWFELTGQIPRRQWVGLTDEDIYKVIEENIPPQLNTLFDMVKWVGGVIETKLKEKNHG